MLKDEFKYKPYCSMQKLEKYSDLRNKEFNCSVSDYCSSSYIKILGENTNMYITENYIFVEIH